jgi:cation diffusion facilitator CzcD-associated flavoprotein CzcO
MPYLPDIPPASDKSFSDRSEPMMHDRLPIAVIGAGPIGLAAACHLLARGERPLILEAGDGPGHAIRQWAHVSMFSPWEFNTDKAAVRLLEAHGWRHPPAAAIPTGRNLVADYLEPLAQLPSLQPHIRYGARVTAVTRPSTR